MRKRVVELHGGKIMRDEYHGSYDSAKFFPDADVEAKAQQALSTSANAPIDDVPAEDGDNGQFGNEGIARLASSVHSGRTGRYGEVFVPLEQTLTWGKGLSLDELEQAERIDEAEPVPPTHGVDPPSQEAEQAYAAFDEGPADPD